MPKYRFEMELEFESDEDVTPFSFTGSMEDGDRFFEALPSKFNDVKSAHMSMSLKFKASQ